MDLNQNQKREIYLKNKNSPRYFRERVLGNGPLWEGQEKIIQAVETAQAGGLRRIAIKAGKNLGKTYELGEIALWFLFSSPSTLVVTTAPSNRQIKTLLWGEIHKHYIRSRTRLGGTLDLLTLKIKPDWYAIGFATDKPVNASGFHSKRALVLIDEAQGVPDEMIDELEGVISGDESMLIMSGNPTRTYGRYYEAFKSPLFQKLTLSCLDHPNVLRGTSVFPGMVSKEWVESRREAWGESSPLWQANVVGEFPEQSSAYIVSITDFDFAGDNILEPTTPVEAGLDVADMGDDENVITIRMGNCVLHQEWWSKTETMDTAAKAMRICNDWKVQSLKIDSIGVGSGVASQCRKQHMDGHLKARVKGINVAEAANDPQEFSNRRAEMWLGMGDRFRRRQIDLTRLKNTEELQSQMTNIKEIPVNSRNQRRVEPKDEIKKRGGHSPDRGDSLCLAFYDDGKQKKILTL